MASLRMPCVHYQRKGVQKDTYTLDHGCAPLALSLHLVTEKKKKTILRKDRITIAACTTLLRSADQPPVLDAILSSSFSFLFLYSISFLLSLVFPSCFSTKRAPRYCKAPTRPLPVLFNPWFLLPFPLFLYEFIGLPFCSFFLLFAER
ncbi:hypothetical protein B0I35DRAFT_205469 [Stachybotrys elegans]|uniref:Transmembrane protein n=1 Tax=Stachybotrys elegans TaxID=80388 RepID=A0A8K0SSY6_9HYPO|nr:hypothetical protein B0I35DRAFT_205469 [Stachybotrys elegans]